LGRATRKGRWADFAGFGITEVSCIKPAARRTQRVKYHECRDESLEFRARDIRRTGPIKNRRTGRAELNPAADQTSDDPTSIGNILLAKPHDVRRASCLIIFGLGECRTGDDE